MRRDDVQHALDAMASEADPPASGLDAVLARARRRRVQRRFALIGIAAVFIAAVATVGAITHANRDDHVVSRRPTTTPPSAIVTKPTSAVTTSGPAPLFAPPIVTVSALETWIFTNPPRYTSDGGDTWRGVDLTFRQQTAPTAQAPVATAIAGGDAWVLNAGAQPGFRRLTRVRRGGSDVKSFRFPPLSAGTTVAALAFADENYGWALTTTTGQTPTAVDLFRTRNGGQTWSIANDHPPIAVGAPSAFTRLQLASRTEGWAISQASRDALERTTDGGTTWRAVSVPGPAGSAGGPVPSLLGVFAAGDRIVAYGEKPGGSLYQPIFNVSTDGGNTWSGPRFQADLRVGSYASSPVALIDALHWRILAGRLWATDDGGRTWQQRPKLESLGRGILQPESMSFATPDDGWVSGTTYPAHSAFVRHTTDAGRTWTDVPLAPMPTPPPTTPAQAILIPIAVAAPKEAWLCSDPVRYSADGGRTWNDVPVASPPPNAPIYQRKISAAIPGGEAWVLSSIGDPDRVQITRFEHDPTLAQTFAFPTMASGDRIIEMTFADSNHGWAINAPGEGDQVGIDLYATTDGGRTWEAIAHHPPAGIQFTSATDGWAAGTLDHLEHTTDGGRTWHAMKVPTPPYDRALGVFVTPTVTRDAIVVEGEVPSGSLTRPFFDVSTNGGRTWATRHGPPDTNFGNTVPGAFATLDVDHWQLATANLLWSTSDGGRTWRKVAKFAGIQYIDSIGFLTPLVGFVSGVGAHPVESASVVLQTNDAGTSWHTAAASAPPVSSTDSASFPGDGIEGCPTQPLTPPPAGDPPAGLVSAALDYLHNVRKTSGTVLHVYRVGDNTSGLYGKVFTPGVRSCGNEAAAQSWVVEMIGPPNGGPGGSTLQASVALAHYADGWHVFGRFN